MISVHSCVRGKISVHLPEGWWFRCIHVRGVGFRCIYLTNLMHSCLRGKIPVHLCEGWWFQCIRVWGVRFRCIYLRSDDDFSLFMCEGQDSCAFTWGITISVHSCVRGRISVHLPEEWRFKKVSSAFTWGLTISVHLCVRGTISVHLLEGFDFGASCLRGRISLHLPEEFKLRCIHVWGVGSRWIYLRSDDFGAFIREGQDLVALTWGVTMMVHSFVRGKTPLYLLDGRRFRCTHVWEVGCRCIYLRSVDFGAFMCEG